MIEVKVEGRVVSVQETEPLYVGSVDTYQCRFTFDKSWGEFAKTVIFRVGAITFSKMIGDNDCCDLPWELLSRENIGQQLEVGMYGVSADKKILTSVWDSLGLIREGSSLGADARNPSDNAYEQIMSQLKKIYDAIDDYEELIRSLTQRAETAAQMARESADAAAATFEAIKNYMDGSGGSGIAVAPSTPYCLEYGTLVYSGSDTQTLSFNLSQCYTEKPVFIPYVASDALSLTIEPVQSDIGYYGAKVTVANTSGESIDDTICISAYCAYPVAEESDGQ